MSPGILIFQDCAAIVGPDPGRQRVLTVVIDAGHGGKDPGCVGASSYEKEITLALALKLRQKIQERYPDVRVVLTREKDEFIPLHIRSRTANKAQADLFISLHCNALPASSATKGSETYVLGLHRAESNLAVARRENEAILLEDNYKLNYGDFDPNSPEAYILMTMYQTAYLERSIIFAGMVEDEFHRHAGRSSKGVKQAGFLVLRENAMPSVLVEAGFLTNEEEERFLRSEAGQEKVAESLARAFARYKRKLEDGLEGEAPAASARTPVPPPTTAAAQSAAAPPAAAGFPTGTWYGVQIGAFRQAWPADHPLRKQVPRLLEKTEAGLIKYISGPYSSWEEAEKVRQSLLQSGIKGTFAVTYQGEKRIVQP